MDTYKIVDDKDQVVDEFEGLTLAEAEAALYRCTNLGHNCYIQDESF